MGKFLIRVPSINWQNERVGHYFMKLMDTHECKHVLGLVSTKFLVAVD